jgi:hypothetical protein
MQTRQFFAYVGFWGVHHVIPTSMLVLAACNGDDSFRLCGTLIGEASGDTCEDNMRVESAEASERPLGALHVLCRNKLVI